MAQLITWILSNWQGAPMLPGEIHDWVAWGPTLQSDDVVSIMARSVAGDPNFPERVLQVENVRTEQSADGGMRILYSVRNAGIYETDAYGKTYMILRP